MAASLEPGASVSAVAREAGIHPSQLYGWRRQLRGAAELGFAPVRIAPERRHPVCRPPGTIEIEFATGARMRISGRGRRGDADGGDCGAGGRRRR